MKGKNTSITLIFFFVFVVSFAQEKWNEEQKKVIETMRLLSESTSPKGKGSIEYAKYLSSDFKRWTIGSSVINNKKKWVEGVRKWFVQDWRVSERKQKILEILIKNDFAFTRRIVTETYKGPKGDSTKSKAALAEVWIRKQNKWLLYRVDVHPIKIK